MCIFVTNVIWIMTPQGVTIYYKICSYRLTGDISRGTWQLTIWKWCKPISSLITFYLPLSNIFSILSCNCVDFTWQCVPTFPGYTLRPVLLSGQKQCWRSYKYPNRDHLQPKGVLLCTRTASTRTPIIVWRQTEAYIRSTASYWYCRGIGEYTFCYRCVFFIRYLRCAGVANNKITPPPRCILDLRLKVTARGEFPRHELLEHFHCTAMETPSVSRLSKAISLLILIRYAFRLITFSRQRRVCVCVCL